MKKGNGRVSIEQWFRKQRSHLGRDVPALANQFFPILFLILGLIVAGFSTVKAQEQAPTQSSPSAAPPPASQQDISVPAAAPPEVHHRGSSRSSYDDHLSTGLNDFLHSHHLPFVDAMVFSNASGTPTLVKLSGQVRTVLGKDDAASKSSDFLNQPGIRFRTM